MGPAAQPGRQGRQLRALLRRAEGARERGVRPPVHGRHSVLQRVDDGGVAHADQRQERPQRRRPRRAAQGAVQDRQARAAAALRAQARRGDRRRHAQEHERVRARAAGGGPHRTAGLRGPPQSAGRRLPGKFRACEKKGLDADELTSTGAAASSASRGPS